MAILVNMHDAKSSLSRLVKRAAAGEDILIANHGKPVAMITRLPKNRAKLPWDVFKGKIEIAEDFDAPLPEFKDYL
jgi:antitoxin (DNA-binding transcriptional repressor) of toxin-antitoxin stability system